MQSYSPPGIVVHIALPGRGVVHASPIDDHGLEIGGVTAGEDNVVTVRAYRQRWRYNQALRVALGDVCTWASDDRVRMEDGHKIMFTLRRVCQIQ